MEDLTAGVLLRPSVGVDIKSTSISIGYGFYTGIEAIGNIEYIHAGYEVTDNVSKAERERIGKGVAINVPGEQDQKIFLSGVQYFK